MNWLLFIDNIMREGILVSYLQACLPVVSNISTSLSATNTPIPAPFPPQAIAAKSGSDPCCDWVGEDGAGHFVKMVHNGIEYGDMQLICEAYHLMRDSLGMDHDEMSQVRWGETGRCVG